MGFMDIFKPKYKHSNPEVRIEAVKEIEDEEILKDIAINDENKDVRWLSIEKLESIITKKPFELNQYDIIDNLCKEELSNITDEKELIDIAKNNDIYKMRTHAISKITDEKALIELLNYDKILLALAIVENPNLKDEKILNNLAKYNYSKLVREEAISKIHDQKTLAYIATHDEEKELRKKAKLKISDKRILRDIEKKENKLKAKIRKAKSKKVNFENDNKIKEWQSPTTQNDKYKCRFYKNGKCTAGGHNYNCSANPNACENCYVWKYHTTGDVSVLY